MEGPVLMECYEDVFEEITSKFYSDEPLTKGLASNGDPFVVAASRFGARLRQGGASIPVSLHPPPTPQFVNLTPNADVGNNENAAMNGGGESSAKSNGVASEELWVESQETLSWTDSKVASYNPNSKMYKCADCNAVGFLSRIAEHWLGTHANLKVFRCPRCPYSSAWARCVRMHLTRHHGEQHSDAALWKDNPTLEEVVRLLQNLRNAVDSKSDAVALGLLEQLTDKRYTCPQCPYATDRRDLYTRHENIHKEDKPFHCYICYKMFSRADHVKKHFLRMHKERPYDINLIRRHTGRGAAGGSPALLMPYYHHPLPPQVSSSGRSRNHHHCRRHVKYEVDDGEQHYSKKRRLPKMFSCTYCSWRGVDNWCLKRHLNTHIKPYLCILCDYKAARAERLSTHVLKIHNKRICNKCNFLAEDQSQLNHHVQTLHSHERGLVKCEECPETFDTCSELDTHAILVHNRDILECSECDFKTTNGASLDRHRNDHQMEDCSSNDDGGSPSSKSGEQHEIRCRECGCEFANHASLQTHCLLLHRSQRVTTPRLAYKCSVCQFSCASQTTMMEHMRVHTGEVLQCQVEECAFRTPFDAVLREHVHYVHNDDFISRCPHCGFALSTRQTLTRHFPSHHPKLCNLCLAVIRKHFPGQDLSQEFTVSSAAVNGVDGHRDATRSSEFLLSSPLVSSQVELQVIAQVNRRSRKQSKPRRIIQTDEEEEEGEENFGGPSAMKPSLAELKLKERRRYQRWLELQQRRFAYVPKYRCHLCRPRFAYHLRRNLLLHSYWRHSRDKRYRCEHCDAAYDHQYQVMLHSARAHSTERNPL